MTDISPTFTDNAARSRFEHTEQGLTAFASYRRAGDVVSIPHVEAPMALRGTGAAGRLMTEVAQHARTHKLKLVPLCSYAVAWFRRNPAFNDVLE
ncbi:MAG: GNAT family N-acetyltransferase [Rhodospirillaceae bacterium]